MKQHAELQDKRFGALEGVFAKLNYADRMLQEKVFQLIENYRNSLVDLGREIAKSIGIMHQLIDKRLNSLEESINDQDAKHLD